MIGLIAGDISWSPGLQCRARPLPSRQEDLCLRQHGEKHVMSEILGEGAQGGVGLSCMWEEYWEGKRLEDVGSWGPAFVADLVELHLHPRPLLLR